jgi:ATP-binding cassette subfamily B protein
MAKLPKKWKTDNWYNLGVYAGFLFRYRPLFAGLLLLVLVTEASYLVIRLLFKVIIDKGAEFTAGTLLKPAFISILVTVAIVFALLLALRTVLYWFRVKAVNSLETSMMQDMKRKFFNHIVKLSHSFHTTHKTGSMISRLIRGGNTVERMTDVIVFNFGRVFFGLIVSAAALLYFDKLSALVLVATFALFVAYSFVIQRKQQKYNLEANKAEDIEKANISDIFTNIDSVKHFGKESFVKKKFAGITENTRLAFKRFWNFYRWLDSGQTLILGIGSMVLMYFALIKFLNAEISIGTITFIYMTYGGMIEYMFDFVGGLRGYYRSISDFDELFKYGKIQNDIKDLPNAKEMKITEGEIEFNNVNFDYGKRKIFSNFNLQVPKNNKVALVGHSGSGKTTLLKLLYRLYDIKDGEILIDGKDIRDFKQESLRSELSIVPQECVLFDDTIYNNIAFSNPDATRRDVFRAMKFSQIDKIVKTFPKKEKTIVGERGVRLSSGEKQRVSIARALLANKKVLVLDEATSALDSRTEHEIQEALKKLMRGRTSIIMAHRLSTIMHADKIVVMKRGKIVQMGTHKQLIKQKGEYKHLWMLQKGGYIGA